MRIQRPHHMTRIEACAWVDEKLAEMLQQFGDRVSDISYEWTGDRLTFQFRAIGTLRFKGMLDVTNTDLRIDLPFPLLARGYQRRAETEINVWLDENLP